MTVYERFMMELSNQPYLKEEQFEQILIENSLDKDAEYVKKDMVKQLYFACIDVFEAVCNDVSIMTSFSTEFGNITAAYEFMEARISQLKDKIAALPVDEEEGYNPFSLMYTRGGSKTFGGYISGIPKENISKLS